MFQDLDYYLECIPMHEFGIWSSFLDILDFVRAEVDSLGTYAYDQRKHLNSSIRYFDVACSKVLNNENSSLDQNYNSKKEHFDAANCNKPSSSTYSQTHTKIEQYCEYDMFVNILIGLL